MSRPETPSTPEFVADPSPLPRLRPVLAAQVRYELGVLLRTPRAISTGLALPVLLLVLSGTTRGSLPADRLAGLASVGVTMTAWTTHGIALVAAREAGVLKRWRATPLPAWCYFTARIAATVVVAVLGGAVTVLAGVVLFGTRLQPETALVVAAGVLAGAIACAACATAMSAAVPNVAGAFPILGLSYLPVVLLSGGFGPLSTEPRWLSAVARYLPVAPIVDAVSHGLVDSSPPARDFLTLFGWAISGGGAAVIWFRWEPTRPRHRSGKLSSRCRKTSGGTRRVARVVKGSGL